MDLVALPLHWLWRSNLLMKRHSSRHLIVNVKIPLFSIERTLEEESNDGFFWVLDNNDHSFKPKRDK